MSMLLQVLYSALGRAIDDISPVTYKKFIRLKSYVPIYFARVSYNKGVHIMCICAYAGTRGTCLIVIFVCM